MLSPYEIAALYSEEELLNSIASLKTQRASLLNGQSIQSTNTPDVGITFNVGGVNIESIDLNLRNLAAALQILNPNVYGKSLTKVKRYYTT